MDEGVKCEGCGKHYFPKGQWQHSGCGTDVHTGTRTQFDSSRTNLFEAKADELRPPEGHGDDVSGGTKQRWARDKYNQYMRDNRHRWKR